MVASFGARADVVDSRVFQKSAGENWPAFSERLTQVEAIKDGVIQTTALEVIAYGVAKERKIIPTNVDDKVVFPEFSLAFRKLNGLGETIAEAEFKALGTGKGIYLPEYQGNEVQASMSTTGAPAQVTEVTTPLQVAYVSAEDNEGLRRLQREVIDLRRKMELEIANTRVADNRSTELVNGRLEEIKKSVNAAKEQLNNLPNTAEVQDLVAQVTALSSEFDEVRKLKSVQQEQSKSISKLWIVLWSAVSGLLIVAFALHFFTRRRVSAVENEVATTRMGIDIVRTEVTSLDEHVAEVEDRVASLEDELLPGNTLVMTRNDASVLVAWLSSRAVGEEHTHICRLQDGTQYRIRFTRADGEYVTIKGIRDQQEKNHVGIRNVPTRLRTAAKKGHFIDKWMLEVVGQAA